MVLGKVEIYGENKSNMESLWQKKDNMGKFMGKQRKYGNNFEERKIKCKNLSENKENMGKITGKER